MNKKKIIGLIGDKDGRGIVRDILVDNGYFSISVEDRVKVVASMFENKDDKNDISLVRDRGYKIGSKYWINLTLSMIPKDKDLIVIDDLRLEDVIEGVIKSYYISDQKEKNVPIYIELIYKDKDIEKFKKLVSEKFGH